MITFTHMFLMSENEGAKEEPHDKTKSHNVSFLNKSLEWETVFVGRKCNI